MFVLKNGNGTDIFLNSRESVTQGDPLAMVVYRIGVLSLIKLLKAAHPVITQPCCADNDCALGVFDNIGLHFNLLKYFGPGHRYYPEPLKIFLIVNPDNLAVGK